MPAIFHTIYGAGDFVCAVLFFIVWRRGESKAKVQDAGAAFEVKEEVEVTDREA